MLASTTMQRLTSDAWSTFTPMADAANIPCCFIREEDVRSEIEALCEALQAPASTRERGEIHAVRYDNENIGILRQPFLGRQRTQERNS